MKYLGEALGLIVLTLFAFGLLDPVGLGDWISTILGAIND